MKNSIYVIVAVAIGLAVAFGFSSKGGARALNVNEAGADPSAYSGAIKVAGVMWAVSEVDKTLFGIVDLKELQCNSPNCNKLVLPIRYSGKHPVMGDEVMITGSFIKADTGYILQAEKVKVVQHHKIGG